MSSREHLRRFQFIREIASGGFGSVYLTKVMHADGFSRLVAVKLLKAQWSDSDEVARRMRDEARLLGLLRHRHIVDVIDLTAIDGRAAVIMEYLEAVDLRTVVQEVDAKGTRVPLRAALEMASAVASALDAAYNRPPIPGDKPLRVIHRDIKPSNIMVDEMGMVKVLDFGVARSEIDNRESHTQELQFGSVDYMAPERLFFEPETPASDVYSLAATLFEVLALEKFGKSRGRPARHAAYIVDRLSFLRAQLGIGGAAARELEQLIGSGLAFNHEERPTASEFHQRARALARMVESEDLFGWAEQSVAKMVRAAAAAQTNESPLTGQTLQEDPRAFDKATASPDSQSAGPADILRQGALAEMEDTGAFVPSPQTGAPAQLHGRKAAEPSAESDWDDGPTAVGSLKGPVRVSRPGNTEEARMMNSAGPRRKAAPLSDPSDPFAQLARSPLSPPKSPTAKSKPEPEVSEDGVTEVADTVRPVVPTSASGGAGHYDPEAPEASEPIPPLPAPPGVQARPLAPNLTEPSEASAPEPDDVEGDAQEDAPPTEEVLDDGTADSEDDATEDEATHDSAADETEDEVDDAVTMPSVPTAESVADGPSAGAAVPVVAPPGAVYEEGEATSLFMVADAMQKGAAPVQLGKGATGPTEAAHAETDGAEQATVPSLDEVVPRSVESRYGPDLERLEAEEAGQGSMPVVPVYEPTVDSVSVPPTVPVDTDRQDTDLLGERTPSVGDEESLSPTVPFDETHRDMDEELFAPTEHIVGRGPAAAPTVPDLIASEASGDAASAPPPMPAVARAPDPTDSLVDAPVRSKTPLLAAAGCLFFVLMGGGGAVAVWQTGALDSMLASSADGPAEATTDSPEEVVASAADSGAPGTTAEAAIPDGAMQVAAGTDDIRKMTVSCGDDFREKSTDPIIVPADTPAPCRVEVILNSRRRLRATIDTHTPGAVVCFADGADGCAPE